jgi:Protein of unknown function (DUF4035)
MAFYQLEPFGQIRHDMNAGIIASTLANCWLKRDQPFQAHEFMPKFGPEQEREEKEDAADDGYVAPEDMLKMIDDIMDRQDRRKAMEAKARAAAS